MCTILLCNAQNTTIPKIIPPAPNAASLGKYGQIPVGLATGIPEISIPIYEIKTNKLSLPISLSYHASGVKVDEIPSWVGLGWSLNAAGVITQSTVNLNDTENIGYLFFKPPTSYELSNYDQGDLDYLRDASFHDATDREPDIFFFNFNGKSGKFIFGENNQPILIPNQNLDIQYSNGTFTVVDDGGTIFFFEEKETADATLYGEGPSTPHSRSISWFLTKILSSDKTDSITFEYQQESGPSIELSYLFSQSIGASLSPTNNGNLTESFGQSSPVFNGVSLRRYTQHLIKTIRFKLGRVEFEAEEDREDPGRSRLTDIKIFNSTSSEPIKHTRLEQDYFRSPYNINSHTSDQRLKNRLKLTEVYDNLPGISEKMKHYSLFYNTTPLPPINSFSQDVWGNYNGENGNETLLKKQSNLIFEGSVWNVGESNREPDELYMKAGILTKIIYPTGGYCEFDYEAHRYGVENRIQATPQAINANGSSIPAGTQTVTKTFSLEEDASRYVILEVNIEGFDLILPEDDRPYVKLREVSSGEELLLVLAKEIAQNHTSLLFLETGQQYELVAYSNGGHAGITARYTRLLPGELVKIGGGLRIRQIRNFDGAQLNAYKTFEYPTGRLLSTNSAFENTTVKKIEHGNLSSDPIGECSILRSQRQRMEFTSTTSYPLESFSGSPVGYTNVTQYEGDNTEERNGGKTVYNFKVISNTSLDVSDHYLSGFYSISNSWKNGILIGETQYGYDNIAHQYYPIVEKSYLYDEVPGASGRGLLVGHNYFISGCYYPDHSSIYYHFDYPINSGRNVLKKTTTRTYSSDNTAIETITDYFYDNVSHYYPTRIINKDSKGNQLKIENKYPHDFLDNEVYLTMVNRNIISPIIEQIQTNISKNVEISRTKTNYSFWPNTMLQPSTIQQSFGGNTLSNEVVFNLYDAVGNLLQYTGKDGTIHSFIWDYNGQYPIAEVLNAIVDQVAYTSFETNETGSFIISSTNREPNGKTGEQCYGLSDGNILKDNLIQDKKYTLNCWAKSGTVLVNGTALTPASSETINGWQYFKTEITGSSSITTATISGTALIDEVSLFPSESQMNTYTYKPLVGIVEQTDPNGITTHFEYDDFQRLKSIKDQHRNVLKHYYYHYATSTQE